MHIQLDSAGWEIKWRRRGSTLCVRTYNNFIAVRVCGNPSRYTPLAGTGSSSARTTVLPVTSVASSLKTFFNRPFETVEHTSEIRYCEVE